MALFTGDDGTAVVLKAAQDWRDLCFLKDGSILSTEALWTLSNLTDLASRLREVAEGENFKEKLGKQLASSTSAVKRLAAEVMWFYFLFPHKGDCGPDTKAAYIAEIWGWGDSAVPSSDYLGTGPLSGIGAAGVSYMTRRPEEIIYFVDTVVAWKGLSSAAREEYFTEDYPWGFVTWLDGLPDSGRRTMRNVFLFLIFPERLERIASNSHKAMVYVALKSSDSPSLAMLSPADLDRALYEIRSRLVVEYANEAIDFYLTPLQEKWTATKIGDARKSVGGAVESVIEPYGLELKKCGSKIANIDQYKPLDTKTGFWAQPADATNKPVRWIVHLDATGPTLKASIATNAGVALPGSRRIAFANISQEKTGAISLRVLPAIKINTDEYLFHEPWEWTMLLCFYPALPKGSSGQLLDDFDPDTGKLIMKGIEQPYIFAALIALNVEDAQLEVTVGGLKKLITYQEATNALQKMIRIKSKQPQHPDE